MKQLFDLIFGANTSNIDIDLPRRQHIHTEVTKVCGQANADLQRVVLDHLLHDFLATQPADKVAALRARFDTALTETLPMNLTAVTDRILDNTI